MAWKLPDVIIISESDRRTHPHTKRESRGHAPHVNMDLYLVGYWCRGRTFLQPSRRVHVRLGLPPNVLCRGSKSMSLDGRKFFGSPQLCARDVSISHDSILSPSICMQRAMGFNIDILHLPIYPAAISALPEVFFCWCTVEILPASSVDPTICQAIYHKRFRH